MLFYSYNVTYFSKIRMSVKLQAMKFFSAENNKGSKTDFDYNIEC